MYLHWMCPSGLLHSTVKSSSQFHIRVDLDALGSATFYVAEMQAALNSMFITLKHWNRSPA